MFTAPFDLMIYTDDIYYLLGSDIFHQEGDIIVSYFPLVLYCTHTF